ncbi:MAG: 3-methyl-2-oxobutanoate hydroxymethyltransferase [Gammaproteobacteria bacterium]|nr:3-methyl-2-oxobutanoate hydroxymethyltransferase [Gammaproteobacteria bacterium]MCW9057642.1 3-methyl-2-oxobutanoate hydroxymethyltransferase [Gammaproteobacteria bacterium]
MSPSDTNRVTPDTLLAMKKAGEKIVSLTAYDAAFACLLEAAGVEILLVGDSLGMVLQGHDSTRPVSLEHMIYHAACVARASQRALRVVDMPWHSYDSPEIALASARRLVEEGGAQLVKLEGGGAVLEQVRRLSAAGIGVCGHLGLLPQSVESPDGYRVQGRDPEDAAAIRADALALQEAGASLLVLECVPAALGAEVSRALRIPVIGIGAGVDCDGQVLVLHDLLGVSPGRRPRFVQDFLAGRGSVEEAIRAYVRDVKDGRFPGPEQSY